MLQRSMFFKKYTSPNHNERKGVANPSMIVLHYTGMQSSKAALEHLCDPKSEVSAHYLIEENGKTHNLVPDEKRAWHAGKSSWKGEVDINSLSIGIEVVNPGHEFGYEPFSQKQINAVIKLCQELMAKFDIPASAVVGHSDVAITRKVDPGHFFPWRELAKDGVGLWPEPVEMDYQAAEDLVLNHDAVHELLAGYGYDAMADFDEVVVAFHRHFAPEKFQNWEDGPSEPDVATCARLLSLIRQGHEEDKNASEGL